MKKNRLAIIIILILAVLTVVLFVLKSKTNTLGNEFNTFAVDDTASITKIFIADKNNNSIILKRINPADWVVNDSFKTAKEVVVTLLKTIMNVEVKAPVSKAARENMIKIMASTATKVEIYQKVYRIDLFGKIKWFPHEKLTKTYYVGSATMDNLGTYMLMDKSETPYVTFIQGFNGFLYTRYSPFLKDWRDHGIFAFHYNQLKSVEIKYFDKPEKSFTATKLNPRDFELVSLVTNSKIKDYDTIKMMDLFSSFENIRFEALLNNLNKLTKDSIVQQMPFNIITLTDTTGAKHSIKTFLMKAPPTQVDQTGKLVVWDRDRLYALINDNRDLVMIQYYVFDRIFKPLDFYLYGAKQDKPRFTDVQEIK
ncbi:MAG: hypothetical protein WCQ95_03570 [Bacteroidota bacterium]